MIQAFPFDSRITGYDADGIPQYDHASNAEEFARLLASFLRNGVFGSDMCEVLAAGGMSATVGVGSALVEGRYGYISSPETVYFAAAGERARIDTVVLRRDLSTGVNDMVCAVVKGTEDSSPVSPVLTRDGTIWEIGLADVLIPANSTAVAQNNITDTRLKDDRCGLVAAILTDVDTTHLYDQIQTDLQFFRETEQEAFEKWFEDVQTILDGNAAGNLLNLINGKASTGSRTVMLPVDGWTGDGPYTQPIMVEGVTENSACHIILSYTPGYKEPYVSNEVSVLSQHNGYLLFEVASIPDSQFPVNVLIVNPNANPDRPVVDGGEGVSPTVEVYPIDGGYRLTITDVNGTKSIDVMNGKTPVRTVDYWTPDDKNEIVSEAVELVKDEVGGVSDEDIKNAIEAYFAENPVVPSITINGEKPDEDGNFIVNTLNDAEISELSAMLTWWRDEHE